MVPEAQVVAAKTQDRPQARRRKSMNGVETIFDFDSLRSDPARARTTDPLLIHVQPLDSPGPDRPGAHRSATRDSSAASWRLIWARTCRKNTRRLADSGSRFSRPAHDRANAFRQAGAPMILRPREICRDGPPHPDEPIETARSPGCRRAGMRSAQGILGTSTTRRLELRRITPPR